MKGVGSQLACVRHHDERRNVDLLFPPRQHLTRRVLLARASDWLRTRPIYPSGFLISLCTWPGPSVLRVEPEIPARGLEPQHSGVTRRVACQKLQERGRELGELLTWLPNCDDVVGSNGPETTGVCVKLDEVTFPLSQDPLAVDLNLGRSCQKQPSESYIVVFNFDPTERTARIRLELADLIQLLPVDGPGDLNFRQTR